MTRALTKMPINGFYFQIKLLHHLYKLGQKNESKYHNIISNNDLIEILLIGLKCLKKESPNLIMKR